MNPATDWIKGKLQQGTLRAGNSDMAHKWPPMKNEACKMKRKGASQYQAWYQWELCWIRTLEFGKKASGFPNPNVIARNVKKTGFEFMFSFNFKQVNLYTSLAHTSIYVFTYIHIHTGAAERVLASLSK